MFTLGICIGQRNSPCTLDNIFSCVLGNTNVIQDIYPINIVYDPSNVYRCDPTHMSNTYFHICWGTFVSWRTLFHMYWTTTMCVGQQRHVLGMYWCIGWHRMCVGHIYWTSAPNTHPQYICILRDTHPQYTLMLANIFTQYLYIYMLPNMYTLHTSTFTPNMYAMLQQKIARVVAPQP